MKKIIYTKPDGGVCIVIPAEKADIEKTLGPLTEEAYVEHVLARSVPHDAVIVQSIGDGDIPQDRYFRNAWDFGDGIKIKIDMAKARQIHMGEIRRARDKGLEKLDIETLKGNDVQAEKQILRDIPQKFDLSSAETPEELKALWPAELEKER